MSIIYAEKGVDWRRGQHNAACPEPGSYYSTQSPASAVDSVDSAALSS